MMHLERPCEEQLVGERVLPLEGVRNFRDLGGYRGHGGKAVRWGKLFRSSRLNGLTDRDRQRLTGLELDLVVDFRQEVEREREPSNWGAAAGPRTESLRILPGSAESLFSGTRAASPERTAGFMESVYRDFVLNQTEAYGAMFALMLEIEDANVLLHCAAGKDRTGFGCALILSALGVSREEVTGDYLLTGQCLDTDSEMNHVLAVAPELFRPPMTLEAIRPMFEVRRPYLDAAFGAMNEDAGSVDAYLERRLGLEPRGREELRRRYLYEVNRLR